MLVLVFLLASLASLAAPPMVELPQDEVTRYVGDDSLYLYTLYMAERNSNAGGDGFLTTDAPDSASDDQRNESALDDSLEFRTPVLLSDFRIAGRTTANSGEYKIPLNVFLRATGGQQDVATYTFTLKVDTAGGEITKATEQKEMNACDSILPGSCGWNQVVINLKWTGAQEFTVITGGQLKLFISAESSCEGSSGGPFSPSCDAEVAWGKPDDITDYSSMEFWANALSGSSVRLQQPGALWTDPEVVDWYPNSMPDDRKMNFTVDVRDSLGRFDIQSVSVQLQDPSGTYVVDHSFSENELVEDNNGLRGVYQWVHPANVEHGEYELTLEVIDIQGHSVLIEHTSVYFHRYGISIRHALDRTVEYIAPGQTTPIKLSLRHIGAVGEALDVELDLLTSLGSNWVVEFDHPDSYYLADGGDEVLAILTLGAPTELSNAPSRLEIAVRAHGANGSEVQYLVFTLDLEKLDVYAPPMASLWDSKHEHQIANSSRPESFDSNIPRFVDQGQFTPFYLELFNTGFDVDSFRLDVPLKPRGTVFYFVDNDTNPPVQIEQNLQDGLWHTAQLGRHVTQTIVLYVKPSQDEDDPDSGLMRLEVISAGNNSLISTIEFTPHRTRGIQARVTYDCDGVGNGLGHVETDVCSPSSGGINMRVEVTQTSGSPNEVTEWILVNPANYAGNAEANIRYTQWNYYINDTNSTPLPRMQLAAGDSGEFELSIVLTNQVLAGNHTIIMRIEEATDGGDPERYFNMPFSIEVGEGEPNLEIVQESANLPMEPGGKRKIQMRLKNEGNADLQVLLTTDAPDGWKADAYNPATSSPTLFVEAFSEVSFTVEVEAPTDARHKELHTIVVTGEPVSTERSYGQDTHAKQDVIVQVEINDPSSRLKNELFDNPRTETLLLMLGGFMLIVAWVAGQRRKRGAWDEEEEDWGDDEVEEIADESPTDIPEPVVDEQDDDEVELADDEIELLEEDLEFDD